MIQSKALYVFLLVLFKLCHLCDMIPQIKEKWKEQSLINATMFLPNKNVTNTQIKQHNAHVVWSGILLEFTEKKTEDDFVVPFGVRLILTQMSKCCCVKGQQGEQT